jgi:hypothetical protein
MVKHNFKSNSDNNMRTDEVFYYTVSSIQEPLNSTSISDYHYFILFHITITFYFHYLIII